MRPPLVLPPALTPLTGYPRWVLWRWAKDKTGKPTKPPFQGRAPAKHASVTEEKTWCDFETVMDAYRRSHKAAGVGFVLTNLDGIAALDIDHCRDAASKKIHPWAEDLMRRCNSYAEVTPSHQGIRIIGTAHGPKLYRKLAVPGATGVSVEIYRQAERYITVSGEQISGAALANIDAHAEAIVAQLDGGAFSKQHDLAALIKDGCGNDFGGDRSRALWYVIHQLLRRGDDPEDVTTVILNRSNRISEHCYDQAKPETYARRQVEKAARERARAPSGKPAKDTLIELAADAELSHTPEGKAFADFVIRDHRETWPVRSKGFKQWLGYRYYVATKSAPNSEALQAALGVIEARARYDAPERAVALRVTGLDGRIYIDLCNETWQAVEIDEDDWRVIDEPPVRFRRASGMLPLPIPKRGGQIEALRQYLNLGAEDREATERKFVLTASWLLACLRPQGPYPVLVLAGEQGTAKSTFAAVSRAFIDPNVSALRALPREGHDLFIAANNGWLLAFDNISTLPDWLSDTFCQLSTGGGFSVRQLYTDADEMLFAAMRPIILNGIEDFAGRPDLADRSLFLVLEPIAETDRQSEQKFWEAFEKDRPAILGALLDRVVHGLRDLPSVNLERTPRMADFARWATACELQPGAFMKAYEQNRDQAVETVLDFDIVAAAIQAFAAKQSQPWTGTATQLLNALTVEVGETAARAKEWPKTPKALSGRLRRAAPFLRKAGVRLSFERSTATRTITLQAAE